MAFTHSRPVRAEMRALQIGTTLPVIRIGLALLAALGTASTIVSLTHL